MNCLILYKYLSVNRFVLRSFALFTFSFEWENISAWIFLWHSWHTDIKLLYSNINVSICSIVVTVSTGVT